MRDKNDHNITAPKNMLFYTKEEAINILNGKKLTGEIDLNLYFNQNESLYSKKSNFDELFELRTFVKNRVKSKVQKYWGYPIEVIIPDESERLNSFYKEAWKLREKHGAKLPNSVLLSFLENKISKQHKIYTTNEARKKLMLATNNEISPDIETIKKYFKCVGGSPNYGEIKLWERNKKPFEEERHIVQPSNANSNYSKGTSLER